MNNAIQIPTPRAQNWLGGFTNTSADAAQKGLVVDGIPNDALTKGGQVVAGVITAFSVFPRVSND